MGVNLEGFVRKHTAVVLGGKEFTFSELSLSDFAAFRAWVIEQRDRNADKRRERILREAEKIGGIEPMELLDRIERKPTDEELEAEMETVEGLGYLAYLSLKYRYPEVTLQDAMQIVTMDSLTIISEAIMGGKPAEQKKKETAKAANKGLAG